LKDTSILLLFVIISYIAVTRFPWHLFKIIYCWTRFGYTIFGLDTNYHLLQIFMIDNFKVTQYLSYFLPVIPYSLWDFFLPDLYLLSFYFYHLWLLRENSINWDVAFPDDVIIHIFYDISIFILFFHWFHRMQTPDTYL